jgi:hypothetical protein
VFTLIFLKNASRSHVDVGHFFNVAVKLNYIACAYLRPKLMRQELIKKLRTQEPDELLLRTIQYLPLTSQVTHLYGHSLRSRSSRH